MSFDHIRAEGEKQEEARQEMYRRIPIDAKIVGDPLIGKEGNIWVASCRLDLSQVGQKVALDKPDPSMV